VSILGPAGGHHLHALAVGRDPRRVDTTRRRRSIGSQQALGRRLRSPEELDAILAGTLDRLGRRLRDGHRAARTVVLRLRFGDFSRATRSHSLPEPSAHTPTLLEVARGLLRSSLPLIREQGITLLGVSLGNLVDDAALQLALPFDARSGPALDTALDAVAARFGSRSVTRATQLRLRPALEVPLLEDPPGDQRGR
jgi:DNA polymerase IV